MPRYLILQGVWQHSNVIETQVRIEIKGEKATPILIWLWVYATICRFIEFVVLLVITELYSHMIFDYWGTFLTYQSMYLFISTK